MRRRPVSCASVHSSCVSGGLRRNGEKLSGASGRDGSTKCHWLGYCMVDVTSLCNACQVYGPAGE